MIVDVGVGSAGLVAPNENPPMIEVTEGAVVAGVAAGLGASVAGVDDVVAVAPKGEADEDAPVPVPKPKDVVARGAAGLVASAAGVAEAVDPKPNTVAGFFSSFFSSVTGFVAAAGPPKLNPENTEVGAGGASSFFSATTAFGFSLSSGFCPKLNCPKAEAAGAAVAGAAVVVVEAAGAPNENVDLPADSAAGLEDDNPPNKEGATVGSGFFSAGAVVAVVGMEEMVLDGSENDNAGLSSTFLAGTSSLSDLGAEVVLPNPNERAAVEAEPAVVDVENASFFSVVAVVLFVVVAEVVFFLLFE